jgi:23S rRNA G2445 N2-methylase RlmL
MKSFILVNSGLNKLALKEVCELVGAKGKVINSVVEFEADKKDMVKLCYFGQSFRKVLISLGKISDLRKVDFSKVNWEDYFFEGVSFKVEVEGVSGNEKRLKIGKQIGSKIFLSVKEKLGFELEFDMKKPDVVVLVYCDGKNYFIGIDVCGELDKRAHRVFVNPASFKGDLAYYLVRKSGFVRGDRLVVGFVKDGTIAIEAGLFYSGRAVNNGPFTFEKMPSFQFPRPSSPNAVISEKKRSKICGFDNSMMNIKAAKKNAKIAGVSELIELNKFDLDEMDVKLDKGKTDRLILQVTRKDEDKLNEIYYQADYVLKKKGVVLIVCRSGWEITISDKFKLISDEEIIRGGSKYGVWLIEKK